MDLQLALAPRLGPLPLRWSLVARVAAGVAFVCVATSDWLPPDLSGYGPLGSLASLAALAAWLVVAAAAAGIVLLGLRHPFAATALALCPLGVVLVLGTTLPFAVIAVLAGIVVASAWRSPVGSAVAAVAALATVVAWIWLGTAMVVPFGGQVDLTYTDPRGVEVAYAVVLAGLLAASLAGKAVLAAALDSEQRLVARSAEVEQQSEVTAERARLARDLHDVVAHHVSLIAVRAETAPYTHPGLAADAREVLAEIASDARRALDELRGVLGILGRSVGDDRSPQPSWSDIGALVDRAACSGEQVVLSGDLDAEMDPSVGYVAYRVVQEGLTNARKHAPGAPVAVHLERTPHLAVVSVSSAAEDTSASSHADEPTAPLAALTGAAAGPPPDAGPGHGLVGMRERVEALGGRLVAGRRDGGFTVEAVLPLVARTGS